MPHRDSASPISLTVNGRRATVDVALDTPLLRVLRDTLGLTGTKLGCGIAQCGACNVHLDGTPIPSCSTPVAAFAGKRVTTIEGPSPARRHPVQRAWIELDVRQYGYCQSGQIMSAFPGGWIAPGDTAARQALRDGAVIDIANGSTRNHV